MLQKSIKTNKLKINGKNGLAFLPAVSLIIFEIKLYSISEINCIFPGINFFSLVPNRSKIKINPALITMKRLEFVNDKFIPEIQDFESMRYPFPLERNQKYIPLKKAPKVYEEIYGYEMA